LQTSPISSRPDQSRLYVVGEFSMRLLTLLRVSLLLVVTLLPLSMVPAPAAPTAYARLIPNSPSASAFFWHQPKLYTSSIPQRMRTVVFDPETPGLALAASEGDFSQRT